ncbi:hypothetical protein KDA_66440 [Dictyobacter alpinus]|uniref:Uncharacterized protein n=1 Tax=Dictyobacter alpinus TaxID=2014873 RepID=A0A402BIJ2_9CHLR|nr:hypothetical protein [Dictyobacter alpinus]GCE31160.1 hypothetical protein KDA_66440 [Dictyobacter alpinus]
MLEAGQRELKLFQEFKAFMRQYSGWYIFFLFLDILLYYGMLALPAAFICICILSSMGFYALVPGNECIAASRNRPVL